jgi:hypothetical protein
MVAAHWRLCDEAIVFEFAKPKDSFVIVEVAIGFMHKPLLSSLERVMQKSFSTRFDANGRYRVR